MIAQTGPVAKFLQRGDFKYTYTMPHSTSFLLAVGDDACVGCIRWKLASMHVPGKVHHSNQLLPGDLLILDGGDHPLMFPRICGRGCRLVMSDGNGHNLGCDPDEFEKMLKVIEESKNPAFGSVGYNGQTRKMRVSVRLEKDPSDSSQVLRQRAVAYLRALTPEERHAVDIEVFYQNERPVRVQVEGRSQTGQLDSSRLREMEQQAGL
jgi:hypothetical protein